MHVGTVGMPWEPWGCRPGNPYARGNRGGAGRATPMHVGTVGMPPGNPYARGNRGDASRATPMHVGTVGMPPGNPYARGNRGARAGQPDNPYARGNRGDAGRATLQNWQKFLFLLAVRAPEWICHLDYYSEYQDTLMTCVHVSTQGFQSCHLP